jgi:low temperature requirement protein LtrA
MAVEQHEQRVTPLELFFDLVFVFAITQVTGMLAADPTWQGLGRGMLVLGALWWAWAAYAWLTNTTNADEGIVRLAMLAAMGAMLLVSLAVPEAFGEHGVLFGVAYLLVRLLHVALYVLAGRGDRDLLRAVLSFTPTVIVGSGLIVLAGFLDGAPQVMLWVLALTLDYLGPLVSRGRGWRLSPAHFAERHGLIVIIALGESIVALGVGAAEEPLGVGLVSASLLAVGAIAALWWAYFDVVAIVAQRRLSEARGAARATLARDSYSYLHLPMIAGIVLFALGLKTTFAHLDDPLDTVPAVGLFGGLALYLLAHVVFRWRNVRSVSRRRLVAAAVLLALVPAAGSMSALAALAGAAAVCVGLVAYEAVRFREERWQVRHAPA